MMGTRSRCSMGLVCRRGWCGMMVGRSGLGGRINKPCLKDSIKVRVPLGVESSCFEMVIWCV